MGGAVDDAAAGHPDGTSAPTMRGVRRPAGVGRLVIALGTVDVGQRLPPLHADPELAVRQVLGVLDQHRQDVDDAGPHPWVRPRPGQVADLGDTEATGRQLVVDHRSITAQGHGAHAVPRSSMSAQRTVARAQPRTEAWPSAFHEPCRSASSNTAMISASTRRNWRSKATSRSAKP